MIKLKQDNAVEKNGENITMTVIVISNKSHLNVWRLTSELLLKNVWATEYLLYVPEDEIQLFRDITPKTIKIEKQESLGILYFQKLHDELNECNNLKRFGWYLQQFYKIEALTKANTDVVAIWDSDCVPVKRIALHNANKLLFMKCSNEHHYPYFENIKRLLELKKKNSYSFVIPGFPFKKKWVSEFIDEVEKINSLNWYEAIIKKTNFKLKSGFSETETLGTWMASRYPNEWELIEGSWERLGQSRFGLAENMNTSQLEKIGEVHDLDIISFENWDVDNFGKKIKRMIKSLKMKIG